MKKIDVLDKGYVLIPDEEAVSGNDLTVVNAARVSYDNRKTEMDEKDERLIKFLAREGHTSPFRHASIQFEVYAPLMVARQWYKYAVSSTHLDDQNGWNESSRRYIKEEPTFYIPMMDEWRSKPANSKQGSGEILSEYTGAQLTTDLKDLIHLGEHFYEKAIDRGVAPEQARLFLPAYGMYVRWYWTTSLQSVAHFLNQRLEHDAQWEIQQYAKAVHELAKEYFPISLKELVK